MPRPMHKVLIVSPRFPPTNAADLHRVRAGLAHYRECGWEPTILCIDPQTSDCAEDTLLGQSLPRHIRVVRVAAWDERNCRRFGFGSLGYRSLMPLFFAGTKLLRQSHYDAVFFSTTVFTSFLLGPLWKRRFGCKIIYDLQDPWYSDVALYGRDDAPGGLLKYRLDQMLARPLEAFALKAADHVVVVSELYIPMLTRRYRWLSREMFTVLPFGADTRDYDFVAERNVEQTIFKPRGDRARWVSAGRAGPDMIPVLTALFESLAALRARDPKFAEKLRLEFVGTNYAPPERTRKLVEPVAQTCGVVELVGEYSVRVPYFEAVALYRDCDAILLLGSVHADYTLSKLLICVLSKKPILALLHRRSTATPIAARFPNVFLATFDETPSEPQFREKIAEGMAWLQAPQFDAAAIATRIRPWSAAALTQTLCAIFDRVCALSAQDAPTPGPAQFGSHVGL
jgi:Glycosyl transferase 4-like domain